MLATYRLTLASLVLTLARARLLSAAATGTTQPRLSLSEMLSTPPIPLPSSNWPLRRYRGRYVVSGSMSFLDMRMHLWLSMIFFIASFVLMVDCYFYLVFNGSRTYLFFESYILVQGLSKVLSPQVRITRLFVSVYPITYRKQ